MNRHGKSVSPNSSIGYNAFLLVDKELGLFGGYIRGEKEKHYECKKINIDLLTKLDFESFSNFILNSAARKNNKTWAKMLYLTKYIDGKTAENLNLPISKTFKRDGVDGYELEKKLELLNPGLREMVGLYLGLDGDSSRSYVDVAKTVGLCKSRTINILDLLFSAMSRTLGDMKNKLGVVERSEEEILRGDYIEYTNKIFNQMAIQVEIDHILNNLKSTIAGSVLENNSRKTIERYLVKKYMFSSEDKVMRNLNLSKSDAKNIPNDEKKLVL